MKKYLMTVVFTLMGVSQVWAGNPIKVTDGSLKPLQAGGTATVKINMDKTTFDYKMPLREDKRYADIDKYIPEYESEFVREFNETSPNFKMTKDVEADYSIILDVDNVDTYVDVMSFIPGNGTKMWGTLTILKGEEKVAVLILDDFRKTVPTSHNVALEETFEEIAETLAKRIKKGK